MQTNIWSNALCWAAALLPLEQLHYTLCFALMSYLCAGHLMACKQAAQGLPAAWQLNMATQHVVLAEGQRFVFFVSLTYMFLSECEVLSVLCEVHSLCSALSLL